MSLDPTPRRATGRTLIDGIVAGLAGIPPGCLWPGFDPASMPLAVAVVAAPATWLINRDHVDGYDQAETVSGQPPLLRRSGLDQRLVGNSVVDIGGRLTATIFVDAGTPLPDIVALAAHELFHVFQADRYPGWGASEAALLTYPWDDAVNLARATNELALLDRAMAADEGDACRDLAAMALAARRERFQRLPADAQAYENGIELAEGTARFVEVRAAQTLGWPLPALETGGGVDVRRRGYQAGAGWCALLARLAGPDWPSSLPDGSDAPMPVFTDMLAVVVGQPADPPVDDVGWQEHLNDAITAVATEADRRTERMAAVRAVATLTVVVRSQPGSPLRVAGFDPMNLIPLADGMVLHERYLVLTMGETRITVLGQPSLTASGGDHPLFSGLDRAEILLTLSPADEVMWDVGSMATLGIRIDGPCSIQQVRPDRIAVEPGDRP